MMSKRTYVVAFLSVLTYGQMLPAQTLATKELAGFDVAAPLNRAARDVASQPEASLSVRPASDRDAESSRTVNELGQSLALQIRVPALEVLTNGPDTLTVGELATYSIALKNKGNSPANHIDVQVAVPLWIEVQGTEATDGKVLPVLQRETGQLLTWRFEQVDANTEELLTLSLVPRSSRGFPLHVDLLVRPTSSAAQIAVHEPKLNIDLRGPADFEFGNEAPYTIVLSNSGSAPARDVTIDLFASESNLGSQTIGTLAPGAERVVDIRLTSALPGKHRLQAVANGRLGLHAEAERDFVVRREALEVDLTGPAFQYAGAKVVYRVQVKNVGDADAKSVQIHLAIPEGASYAEGIDKAKQSNGGIDWTIDRIPVRGERQFDVVCELIAGGDLQWDVQARSSNDIASSDTARTRVEAVADLRLEVRDPAAPCLVGAKMEYEIRVTNQGAATARQVYVVAVCSPEVEPVDVSGNAAIKAGQIFFRPVAELAAGQAIVHKVTAQAKTAGNHVFHVIVECDQPETRLSTEEATRFFVGPQSPQSAIRPLQIDTRR